MRFLSLICLIFCFFGGRLAAQGGVSLNEWRLATNDDSLYKLAEYDDRTWPTYDATRTNNTMASNNAIWLRKPVYVSKILQDQSSLSDSVRIVLGEITGEFEVYLNGYLIGKGKNSFRQRFTLPVLNAFLTWDDLNVVALRISPDNGRAGMTNCGCDLGMVDIPDYVTLDIKSNALQSVDGGFTKKVVVYNNYSLPVYGTVVIRAMREGNPEPVYEETKRLTIGRSFNTSHTFAIPQLSGVQFEYYFLEEKTLKAIKLKGEQL